MSPRPRTRPGTIGLLFLRGWMRSRGAILWAGLIAAFIGLDWFSRELGTPLAPWSLAFGIAALLGVLGGYDVYSRLRTTGVLRLLLLSPVSLWRIALEHWGAAAILVSGGVLLFVSWLLASGATVPAVGTTGTILVLVATAGLFAAFLQAFSLVMPRDAAVIGGFSLLFLGRAPLASMLPPWIPDWAFQAIGFVLPATWRLERAAALEEPYLWAILLAVVQIGAVLAAIRWRLGSVALCQRGPDA